MRDSDWLMEQVQPNANTRVMLSYSTHLGLWIMPQERKRTFQHILHKKPICQANWHNAFVLRGPLESLSIVT